VALAFTMRTAVGTSLAIITTTALLGLGVHVLAGRTIDVGLSATMAAACAVGALAGARAASEVPQRVLGRGFAVLVGCVAVYLVASVALLGGPPGAG